MKTIQTSVESSWHMHYLNWRAWYQTIPLLTVAPGWYLDIEHSLDVAHINFYSNILDTYNVKPICLEGMPEAINFILATESSRILSHSKYRTIISLDSALLVCLSCKRMKPVAIQEFDTQDNTWLEQWSISRRHGAVIIAHFKSSMEALCSGPQKKSTSFLFESPWGLACWQNILPRSIHPHLQDSICEASFLGEEYCSQANPDLLTSSSR